MRTLPSLQDREPEASTQQAEGGARSASEHVGSSDRVAAPQGRARPVRNADVARTEGVAFRDPPSVSDAAAPLEQAIARILVGAPSLPVELRAFRLWLLGVKADKRGIELCIGPADPVARLRLTRGSTDERVVVAVRAVHDEARRWSRELALMAERLQAAITPTKWQEAWAIGRELAKLPVDVPLGFFRQFVAGVDPPEALVRVGFGCNQDCGMCWQGRDWGRYGVDQILRWIEDLRGGGARSLIVSGGEPTLDPEVFSYVRHAHAVGFTSVTLETNAIQIAKPGFAARLLEAGVTCCFVSLHSGNAEVSDAITRAPGTHARTVKGVSALLDAGVPVVLNAVMTAEGLDHLGALPDFIHASFGRHRLLQSLMISYPTEPFEKALSAALVPDPARLRAALAQAIDRALALGIPVRGLDGPCGPALCAFGADRRVTERRPVPGPVEFRVHLPSCTGCAVKDACFGVRRAEVARFGERAVMPIVASGLA